MRMRTLNGGTEDEPLWGQWSGGNGASEPGPNTFWSDANGNPTDGTWGQPPGDSNPDHFKPQSSGGKAGVKDINATSDGSSTGSWVATLWPVIKDIVKGWSFAPHSAGFKRWKDAGDGVHDWFTNKGPQNFLDWMDANHPDAFGNLQDVKNLIPQWLAGSPFGGKAKILTPDGFGIGYSNVDAGADWYTSQTPGIYEAMGIDYPATVAAVKAAGVNDLAKYVKAKAGGVVDMTAQNISQGVVDHVNDGTANADEQNFFQQLVAAGAAYVGATGKAVLGGSAQNSGTGNTGAPGGGVGIGPGPTPSTANVAPIFVLLLAGGALFMANRKKK